MVQPIESYLTFIGTCEKSDLFEVTKYKDSKSGLLPKYPIKGTRDGDIIVTSDTNETFCWLNNKWEQIGDSLDLDNYNGENKRKKIIPWPSKCVYCGANLHSYTCDFCGTEYPSFEYIIETEE